MTQEEKAKAYDEALERAKYYKKENGSAVISAIFPELKESEDERILEIIKHCVESRYLHTSTIKGISQKQCFAWLEKQVEHIEVNPSEFDLRLNKLLNQFESLSKEELASSLSFYLNVVQNNGTYKQKHTDNFKPKFKTGDWIISKYMHLIMQISNNDNGYYETVEVDGTKRNDSYDFIERNFKLWTIQDAKDGDVIACPLPKGYETKEQIFIFKSINNRVYVDNCIEYYCNICDDVFYVNENDYGYMGTTSTPLYPATKEQHDLLFQKMHEAGYMWDSESKQLLSLKAEPSGKQKPSGKQNSTWSEEDEEFLRRAINATKDIYPMTANWLKSLKDRIIP